MSGAVIGGIEIQMLADLARLRQDMDSAKGIVGKATDEMGKMAAGLKTALGALGLGLSAAAFAGWIKGAIDAADEASKMAQKIGVATKDVAGLQLAFKLGGVESGAMQTAMVKLSQNVANNSDLFTRLGVSVRNADGSLKSSKQVLYEVTDVFKGMPGGINKTALATEIFGKAGADLVPMLGAGSKGLKDMAAQAERLGLVIDDETGAAAESFNDTLEMVGLAGQGVARQIGAQMLPTLDSLATAFLSSASQSDYLKRVAENLGSVLSFVAKVAGTLGLAVIEVFSTLVKGIGGAAAMVWQFVTGDFAAAADTGKTLAADIGRDWKSLGSTVVDVWTGAGKSTVEESSRMDGATRKLTIATKEQADAAKTAATEQAKLTKAGHDYLAQLEAQHAEVTRALSLGRDLTDVEKQLLKLAEDLAHGKITLTAAERASAEAKIIETGALRDQLTLNRELLKLQVDAQNARLTESASIAEQTAKQLEQNATIGKTAAELRTLELARIDVSVATAEQALQTALLKGVSAEELEGYTLTVEELRRLKKAKEDGAMAEAGVEAAQAAKEAASEWKKTTDSINAGLTDALLRAFESGKGFWLAFRDTLVNAAKTLVLKPIIEFMVRPVGTAVGSVLGSLGLGGNAAAGTGGGAAGGLGGLGGLGNLGSLFSNGAGQSWLTNFGGNVGNLAGELGGNISALVGGESSVGSWLMGNSGKIGEVAGMAGDALGYLSAFSDLTKGNYGAAAGSALGTYFGGPIGGAIGKMLGGMADKVFAGGAGTPHTGSVVGITGTEASTMHGDASGILNNYNAGTDEALRGAGGIAVGALNTLAGAFGGAQNFSAVLKFAADGRDASIGDLLLNRGNTSLTNWGATQGDFKKYAADGKAGFDAYMQDVATATRAALDAVALPQWAQDTLGQLTDSASLGDIAGAVQAVAQTQRALQGLQLGIQPLGGVFEQVAGLSSDALFELTKFAGGIEAFAGKIKGYVGAFYSEQEQAALSAASIQKLLTDAGISTAGLTSKADFRGLVDSTDVSTEAGRRQLAALLDAAQAFAGISDVLAASGGSLADLAGLAPRNAVLGTLLTDQQSGNATASSASLLGTANGYLTAIADSSAASLTHLAALVAVQSEGLQAMLGKLTAIGDTLGDIAQTGNLADLANDGTPAMEGG